eukprot:s2811_g4.t1
MAGTKPDPISAALGSGGQGTEGAVGGAAKGITAREAYVKIVNQQTSTFTTAIRNAAASELGYDTASLPSSLMREYAEKRMVLPSSRDPEGKLCWRPPKTPGPTWHRASDLDAAFAEETTADLAVL